jgi:hypothetical protein
MRRFRPQAACLLALFMACGGSDKAGGSAATRPDTGASSGSEDSAAPPDTATPEDTAIRDTAARDTAADDTGSPPIAIEGYPRIVARPADRALILAQLDGTGLDPHLTAFHQTLYANLASSCASTPPDIGTDPIDAGAAYASAIVARNCAMLAWLDGDAEAATQAALLLSSLGLHPLDLDDLGYDVHLSTALALSIEAWDLLNGSGLLSDPNAAAEPVLQFTRNMWGVFVDDYPFILWGWQNNHNLKMVAAFGMAGLVFEDAPEAMDWLGYAQTEHAWLLGQVLGSPAGGYAEGPYYQNYFAFQTLPYLRAYHRLVGEMDREWPVVCATRPTLDCDEHTTQMVGDLWTDASIQAQLTWNRRIRMPDGNRPPIDDGVPVGFPSGMLSDMDPAFTWDWTTQASPMYWWAGDISAEILAALSGPATAPTESPSFTSPETGVAILSTGHGSDATWAMLLGESEPTALGGGHEHPDAGTFQLYARGTYMAIDAGYAGWTLREETNRYADHNGLLIDGAAPPTAESGALAIDWTADLPDGEAAVRLDWAAADWTRHLTLSEDRLVVRDAVATADPATVQWRLHLPTGDGRGTLETRSWGGIIRWSDAALVVAITADAPLMLGTETGRDALVYGTVRDHDVLTANAAAVDALDILTVLQVVDATAEPAVTTGASTITIDGITTTY